MGEGLADIIATDFLGHPYYSIPFVLQYPTESGIITLPRAIQLSTNAPARIIPLCRLEQEIVELRKEADLYSVGEDDMSKGRYGIIDGRIVVKEDRFVQVHRNAKPIDTYQLGFSQYARPLLTLP